MHFLTNAFLTFIDISNTLSSFYAVNVSPTFCSSLFVPLIQHAIRNKRDLENLGSHYSHTIAQLHDYVCDQHIPQNTQIIKDATLFLRDIIKTYKKRFNALVLVFLLRNAEEKGKAIITLLFMLVGYIQLERSFNKKPTPTFTDHNRSMFYDD